MACSPLGARWAPLDIGAPTGQQAAHYEPDAVCWQNFGDFLQVCWQNFGDTSVFLLETWCCAEWLDMDPEADADLMYLAREGLKAPLTDGWKTCLYAEGLIFDFKFVTGQSSWVQRNFVTFSLRPSGL